MIRTSRLIATSGALRLLAVTALAGAITTPAFSATLSGAARYEGPPIRPVALKMNADPKCEEAHAGTPVPNPDTLVGADGGLANVFVYLKQAPAGAPPVTKPSTPVSLVQKGCMYEPRVQGIIVEQQLEVENADPTLHNVRCLAKLNRPFNLGQPAMGKRTKFFTKPEEAVRFKCDVHPWMTSYVFVMDHPYFAVTDEAGHFQIDGLPAGHYTLTAWHEKLGQLEQEVDVKESGGSANFTFKPAP